MKKKYLVFEDGSVKVFDAGNIHAFMTGGKKAVSGGFCEIDIKTFGESTTVGVHSTDGDDIKLAKFFGL